ncbi:M56 family metallopeptidase [Niabella yanshanensis]|uniref:M56 family metallopeptidase n=1 Tax=Niabella yanshanensis TaxID=577386 RepID=A0ABZ0WCC8_9BACT|nr:M56 family metallopeptidase [Niabella yanshanensis]WQD39437.1 M56 family metallopeptidase [Niabella yanshanensis]
MLIYLIKAIACSGIFYVLYALLFNKEKMLVFNRFYLLGSLVASFLIPLITITVEVPEIAQQHQYIMPEDLVTVQYVPAPGIDWVIYMEMSAIALTVIVSCFLLVRFLLNFLALIAVAKNETGVYIKGIRVVLLNGPIAPHSFLNTIYLSKAEYERGGIETEIMAHEMAHIRQKHSWDILFVELLKIFTWFNPFIYLYKRSVMINHELLADAAVVKQLGDVRSYQLVLLQRAATQSSLALVSSFTFYIAKKRLTMLLKKSNKKRTVLLSLALIPVTTLVVFVGCNTVEKKEADLTPEEQKELARAKEDALSTISKDTMISVTIPEAQPATDDAETKSGVTAPQVDIKKFSPPKIIRDMPEGPGASAKELATYEEIIRQVLDGKKNKYKWIEGKSDKLLPIYQKMTFEQRRNASQLPPPPPPKIEVRKFTSPK